MVEFLHYQSAIFGSAITSFFFGLGIGIVALIVLAVRTYQENMWIYAGLAALVLIWLICPNGWHSLFEPEATFDLLLSSRNIPPPEALFKAELVGVLLGLAAAAIGGAYWKSR
ncbi:hypothetical protein APT63_11365 [Pseudomonas sp. 22-AL-CL-001]|nr:hypothetical protein APT63_11365 [Pseudomonas monteilii]